MLTCVHSGAKLTLGSPPEQTVSQIPGAGKGGLWVTIRRYYVA